MATLASITDDFTTGAFDGAKWSNSGDATKTGGRARIPSIAGSYKSLRSVNTTLRNGYVIAQLYPPAVGGAGSEALMGMSIAAIVAGDGDGREINVEINKETGLISFRNFVDWWEDGPTGSQITYNATNHRWVGISDGPAATYFGVSSPDATKIYFFTSPTGAPGSWTEQRGGASRLSRPSWITATEDQQLWFTAYRASGTTEYVEVDNVNLPTAAPTTTAATSTFQDNFSTGTIAKWPASSGTGVAVVTGKATLTSSPAQRYPTMQTDIAGQKKTLDYLEAEIYVEGGSSAQTKFGIASGVGGEAAWWLWDAGNWIPNLVKADYGNVGAGGTGVAAAANSTLRLAMALGSAATRYGESSPIAGTLYFYTAPAGTTTWTKRYTVSAANVTANAPWLSAAGGRLAVEHSADGVGTAKVTVDDVNLLTNTVVPTLPSAPVATATRVSGTPTSIRVDWSAPSDTGNSAIIDYEISKTPPGSDPVTVAASLAHVLIYPDQSLSSTYSITVRARNGVGYSPATTVSVDAYTAPTGLPLLGGIADDFNDSTLDAGWITTTGVVQAAGSIFFPAPSATPSAIYYRGSAVGQSMSWLLKPVAGAGVITGMFLRQTSNRNQKLRIFVRDGVIAGAYEQGVQDPSVSARPYSAATDTYVRIRHVVATGRIHLETSGDGQVWAALGRSDFAAPTWLADAEVGVEVYTGAITPPSANVPTVPLSVVRGAPVLAADGTYSVNMTWQPPTSDGGSQITGYQVSRDGVDSLGGGAWSQTVAPTARNQSFTLLVPGVTYTFAVRAVNANGQGAVSSASLTMPASTPTPPAAGAVFTDDFLTLPNFTGSGTVWFPGYVYWGGYAGAFEPAGNSWNAVPGEVRNGLSVQPYSIIDDAAANDGKALRITCRKATAAEKTAFGGKDWIGGSMESKAVYTYGYFEWRMRLPNPGIGMFPALWLMSAENPDNTKLNDDAHSSAELDVLEVFGIGAGKPWSAGAHMVPGGTVPGGNAHVGLYTGQDDTTGWHTYGLEWTATKLRIWRDGVMVAQRDDLASWFKEANSNAGAKMRIRMNYTVATGGNPSWMPSTDASTPSALYMDIDYMKVYSQKPGAQDVIPGQPATSSVTNLQPTTLTINWTPPTNEALIGVTGYVVSWGGWTSSVLPATTRSMDLTGFSASTAYTISIQAVNAAGLGPAKTQAVTTPASTTTPTNPALQGVPTRVTGVYVPNWNGTIDCMSIPASYNTLYLFAATKGSTAGQYVWGVTNPTNIPAARARGQRIILSLGGAGQGYGFTTAGEVTAFVNSVIAINTQWGGTAGSPRIDGIDLNTYEGGITPNLTLYQSIATQLRAYFGANFIVTSPPAPWNGVDKTFCAGMLASGHFNYVSPQYYDGPGLEGPTYITSTTQDWITNVAAGNASKIAVGFGVAPGTANYSTIAQVQTAWNAIEAANPTIRGAFLWEGNRDRLDGWPYATTINPLVAS